MCLEVVVPLRNQKCWGLHLGTCCLVVRQMFLWQRFNKNKILKNWKVEFLYKDPGLGSKHLEQTLWMNDGGRCVRWGRWFSGCLLSQSGRSAVPAWFSLLLPVLVVPRKTFCWSDLSCCAERKLPFLSPSVRAMGLLGVPEETRGEEEHKVILLEVAKC